MCSIIFNIQISTFIQETKINFAGETSLNQLYVNKASCKRNLFYIFILHKIIHFLMLTLYTKHTFRINKLLYEFWNLILWKYALCIRRCNILALITCMFFFGIYFAITHSGVCTYLVLLYHRQSGIWANWIVWRTWAYATSHH